MFNTHPLPAPQLEITLLVDLDSLSHGLAEGSTRRRADDEDLATAMSRIRNSANRLGHVRRERIASSSETAIVHQNLLFLTSTNVWAIRRGLDGADGVLLEEMHDLVLDRAKVSGAVGRRRALVLCGQDSIYAPSVRRLRDLGVPTWLIAAGRYLSSDLYRAAVEVTRLAGPRTEARVPRVRPVRPLAFVA